MKVEETVKELPEKIVKSGLYVSKGIEIGEVYEFIEAIIERVLAHHISADDM